MRLISFKRFYKGLERWLKGVRALLAVKAWQSELRSSSLTSGGAVCLQAAEAAEAGGMRELNTSPGKKCVK